MPDDVQFLQQIEPLHDVVVREHVEPGADRCLVQRGQIDRALLDRQIYGGKDLSGEFPELGQSALYCVTEVHTQADIDRLAGSLAEVLAQ